jgi:hypothetical protein
MRETSSERQQNAWVQAGISERDSDSRNAIALYRRAQPCLIVDRTHCPAKE